MREANGDSKHYYFMIYDFNRVIHIPFSTSLYSTAVSCTIYI